MKTRVVVLADTWDRCHRMSSCFSANSEFELAGSFTNLEVLLDSFHERGLDTAVLAGMNTQTADTVATLKKRFAGNHVIVALSGERPEFILALARAGVDGYLPADPTPEQLLGALRAVRAGGAPMSDVVALCFLRFFREASAAGADYGLSARERNMLEALVDGLSYKMVADRYSISIDTVRSHVKHVYEKLHVHSKSEAVAKALRERLL